MIFPPRFAASIAAALLVVFGVLAGAALAQDVPVVSDEVTDEVGALTSDEAEEVRTALGQARTDGVHLFVLYTDTTGGRTATAFADEVAVASSMGGSNALLVVALEDRVYATWVSDALPIADDQIDAVNVGLVEPRLAAEDWAGAAVAAAQGLVDAAAAGPQPAPDAPAPVAQPQPRGLGSPNLWPIFFILVAIGGALTLGASGWRTLQERRGARRSAEERDARLGALSREASAQLLASDEAVREAEHELVFARSRFRAVDVAPLAAALDQARAEVREAFAVRHRLDDAEPETPDEREALLQEILDRTTRVDEALRSGRARVAELVDLEREAPRLLAELAAELDDVAARVTAAGPHLERVQQIAAGHADALRGNLVEAATRVEAARASVEAGLGAAEGTADAVNALLDAQEAEQQAIELVEAVERLAAAAAEAAADLEAEIRAAAADVDAARRALADGRVRGFTAQLAEAEALLERAHAEASEQDRDVLSAYTLATQANAAADVVLDGIREADERRQREIAAAQAALRTAEAEYVRAADYVTTRRRGVGREARTRLGEADRHLRRARSLVENQAKTALEEARTAERLAVEAYRLAQRDFDDYDRYQGPFGRGPYGGGWGGRRGRSVIVIGGFPIPMGGSGRGGGGWGGSSWGSGGFGGGIGGAGRSSGGGFGGGRSMGGGFGGGLGGGRSSGGRF